MSLRTIVGILLTAGAAYAFSFESDLLLGGWAGVYPSTVYPAVITWSVISAVLLFLAFKFSPLSNWLALPFAVFGALALFGALVGSHPHSYGVAILLFILAFIIWRLASSTKRGNRGSLQNISGPATFLKQPLNSVNGLHSLSQIERLTLRANFKDEEIHRGPPQQWLDRQWELFLAAVGGTIYKVVFETIFANEADAVRFSATIFSVLEKAFGKHTEKNDALFVWDAVDGNAVLQFANVGGERWIILFLTSSIVRTFVLK